MKTVGWILRVVMLGSVLSMAAFGAGLPDDLVPLIEDTSATGSFDVYHWWTAGGEKEAFEAALSVFERQYPGVDGVSNAIPGGAGGAMVMKVKVLVITGNSPESFQAHPGYEINPYSDSDMLYPLNDIWEYDNLVERLLPGIADLCAIGDDYYLVPIGLHRTNEIWYNRKLFEDLDVALPTDPMTWDAFWALCEELQSKLPDRAYALDLGDRKGWPATQVFETIMMGTDPQIYENFVNGTATEEEIQNVLTVYKQFLGYVAPDHTARLWYESAGELISGNVAMVLQGGWIKAYFNSRDWVYGEDYGAFEAPGTDGMFGLAVDAFVVPMGSDTPENGVRWAHMCSDTELQETFSSLKGSISPYRDTSTAIYGDLTLEFLDDLLADTTLVYPSFTHGIALPWSVLQDLHSRITDFTTSSNPDVARHARLIVQSLREAGIEPRWNLVD